MIYFNKVSKIFKKNFYKIKKSFKNLKLCISCVNMKSKSWRKRFICFIRDLLNFKDFIKCVNMKKWMYNVK